MTSSFCASGPAINTFKSKLAETKAKLYRRGAKIKTLTSERDAAEDKCESAVEDFFAPELKKIQLAKYRKIKGISVPKVMALPCNPLRKDALRKAIRQFHELMRESDDDGSDTEPMEIDDNGLHDVHADESDEE